MCWRRELRRTSACIFPRDLCIAVDAIQFRMDQSGLTVKDLEPVVGCKHRVYDVLSGRRP